MLVSLLSNNNDVKIFVLTEGLTVTNVKIITEEVERLGGKVDFCQVDSSIVERFPMPNLPGLSHISRATYYRLLIADLLPEDIHKALYLDCDMIINHSLDDLWNLDITNYALAASLQIGFGYEATRLGYPIEYGYFNAGMNLINLDYFRKNNTAKVLFDYIRNNYSRIKYHDQDTLNATLYDKTLHVLPQWNMTSAVYVYQLEKRGDMLDGVVVNKYETEKRNAKDHLKDPYILHYVAKPKPWQHGCIHPLSSLYFKYASKTLCFSHVKQESLMYRLPFIIKSRVKERLSSVKQMIVKTDKTRLQ